MKDNNIIFTFNSTGSMDSQSTKLFTDNNLNTIIPKYPEFGVYNKVIDIHFSKLFYIKIVKIGFGDIVDFITNFLYIKHLIVYLTKGNCGCEARRVKFNKWFKIPFIKFGWREILANDLIRLEKIKKIKKTKTHDDLNKEMLNLYLFNQKNDSKRSTDMSHITENYIKNEFTQLSKQEKIKLIEQEKTIQTFKPFIRQSDGKAFNLDKIKVVDQKIQTQKPINASEIRGGCGCKKNK